MTEYTLSTCEGLGFIPSIMQKEKKSGVTAHACNPSPWRLKQEDDHTSEASLAVYHETNRRERTGRKLGMPTQQDSPLWIHTQGGVTEEGQGAEGPTESFMESTSPGGRTVIMYPQSRLGAYRESS